MHKAFVRGAWIIIAALQAARIAAQAPPPRTLAGLEARLEDIDAQLARLASFSLGSGIGAIGFRSYPQDSPRQRLWIEVDFGRAVTLDEVVLVPAIRRDAVSGFQADGFPRALRLLAGTGTHDPGTLVAEFTERDNLLPRIAPLAIPCPGVTASWIRVEARTLSLRAFDERYVFQLSEVLAFSGEENVALHRPVTSSAGTNPVVALGWADAYAVDGFVPYLMDAAEGGKSVAFHSPRDFSSNTVLTIDLGERQPLSGLHLHAVDQSDTVPQAFAGDFGLPKRLRVEAANAPDFSDAALLVEYRHESIYDVGQIMMWNFPARSGRYVRVVEAEPAPALPGGWTGHPLGFAEIELWADHRNVAWRRPVTANFSATDPKRLLAHLTDGLNFYGAILPAREWLNQLAERHELERERPRVAAELGRRYARQRTLVTVLVRVTILLASGVIILVVVDRIMRQRAIERARLRIAADLHDELGADLHALGLLSDLAGAAREKPEKMADLLRRMRSLTERAGKAARHCTNMLEARGLYDDLVDDMRRAADRMLADIAHEIEFEGEETLRRLGPRTRGDLFLFNQECLVNIIRHSGATRVDIRLTAGREEIHLSVADDGVGLSDVPSSLRRRARLLGAAAEVEPLTPRGVCIHLRLKSGRFRALR